MIFNDGGRDSHTFHLGNHALKQVETYTYLGFNIHRAGSLSHARTTLRLKAMRALYSLKRTINKTKLSHRSLCTLFDALVKPVVLYGAPIWCPSIPAIKYLGNLQKTLDASDLSTTSSFLLNKLSELDCERIHLHFVKWSLGVHRRSSNIGTWGETGRYPLAYECIKLTLNYLKRIASFSNTNKSSLAYLAYKEQQIHKLDRYMRMEPLLRLDDAYTTDHVTLFKNKSRANKRTTSHDTPFNTISPRGKHLSSSKTR